MVQELLLATYWASGSYIKLRFLARIPLSPISEIPRMLYARKQGCTELSPAMGRRQTYFGRIFIFGINQAVGSTIILRPGKDSLERVRAGGYFKGISGQSRHNGVIIISVMITSS